MGPFIQPFLQAVLIILGVLQTIIFVWVVLSWVLFFFRQSKARWKYPKLFRFLAAADELLTRMTYPFLKPFRKMLRRFDTAGIDWSPLLLLLAIFILEGILRAIMVRLY